MSDSQNMSDEVRARLRAIPSVNELLAEWPVVKAAGETCDAVVHAAVTAELDEERAAIRAGAAPRSKRELASAIEFRAHRSALPSLRPAVNATGVVIHTNLGRAPLAESAAKAVAEVARGYSTLEYSVDTCSRGSRKEHAAQLIRSLTGAEDALVVNNNAAAVLLVLATHAAGKEVIVSRGELVEIGGSFRIPDVMEASGAKLVEVGATNRTHLSDYERAITPDTAMILKVHPSNYRIEGFHEEVGSRELAALAREHGLPESILRRAEHYLLQDGQDTSALLGRLNALAAEREQEIARLRQEQEKARRDTQIMREKTEKERLRLHDEVRAKAGELMRAWKEGRATHKQALKEMSRLRADLAAPVVQEETSVLPQIEHFAPGQQVFHTVFNKAW